MPSKPLQEWLSEYKSLPDEQVHTFACTVRENIPLIECLYTMFEGKPSVEDLDPVCHQLFEFYRSPEESLRRFALEFVPTLICLYLRCLSLNDKKSCGGLEAFLLGVYNLEIVNKDGSSKVKSFRIPSVLQSSVYHEPQHLNTLTLTESTLNRYNKMGDVWKGGPYPQYENLNGQNRQAVLAQLVQVYNADIAQLANHSLEALCQAVSRISSSGLPSLQVSPTEIQSWPTTNGPRPKPTTPRNVAARVTVSPALLIEMLWGLNFAMYNGCDKLAIKAVQDVHARACYELLPDVQLVTDAILNSDRLALGGMGDAGPMGISMASATATMNPCLSKTITNASFKTKKLPEDIPVNTESESPHQSPASKLSPIEEEHKGIAKQVLRLSKGRKKDDKEKEKRSREACKDSDTSSNKSLVLNGDGMDSVNVSIVKRHRDSSSDSMELLAWKRYSEDHPVANGNNSAHKSGDKGSGDGEVRSRPNSFHGAVTVNPESFSTDL